WPDASWGCRLGTPFVTGPIFMSSNEPMIQVINATPISSKGEPQGQLESTGVAHGGDLFECRRRAGGICSGPESSIEGHTVYVIQKIEGFGHGLHAEMLAEGESPAQASVHVQKIEAAAGVAIDEDS